MSALATSTNPAEGGKWTSQQWDERFKNVQSPLGVMVRESGKQALQQQENLQASQDRLAAQQADINKMQAQTASRSYSTLRARRGRAGSMSLLNNESTLG